MRKALKNNLLEVFKTIYEAHEIVKGFIDKKEYENAQNLLADCQNTAIQLGNLIEESEGEGFVTVSFLEEYCEALYEAATNLSERSNGHKVQKQLDKKIINAENSAKNDIKVKLEIVFMPYKASMWDSLESVWKAADEDPDCNAYVVPIPYYDRKPDRSFGEFHYEGGDYPDYVPVVHYETYNLEQHRPDVIYIHNPYDDCNYVTSVDPRFYARELKKYTDKLVYIPYFVVSDNVPEHFCTVPACIYADNVFVQSEMVRETYINTNVKHNVSTSGDLFRKFVALGSPKFDCIVNKTLGDYALPEDWKRKIENKKVILYNTSVAAILDGNVQYLEKIKSVLNYFSEHEEVVLWWRPHPLSEAVYDSMRHGLVASYLDLIIQYKKMNFGIYDDTPDLHRAIFYSDAYYGDRSSLVALYQLTGKPVMIQDVKIDVLSEKKLFLDFEGLYDDGNNLWFSTMYFNGLFKMNPENMKPEFVASFYNEKNDGHRLYTGIAEFNEKLYFAPLTANTIAVYDIKKDVMSSIEFDDERIGELKAHFYDITVYGNILIFVPYGYNAILCYNVEKNETTYCDDWVDEVRNSNFFDKNLGYFRNGALVGNKLYLPCMTGGKMVIFDADALTTEVVAFADENVKSHGICTDGKNLWIIQFNGSVVKWDIEKKCGITIELPAEIAQGTFGNICLFNNKLLLMPYQCSKTVALDVNTLEFEVIEDFEDKRIAKPIDGHYLLSHKSIRAIYTYEMHNEQLVVCDIETNEINKKKMLTDNEYITKLLQWLGKNHFSLPLSVRSADECNYLECGFGGMNEFTDYILNTENKPDYERAGCIRSSVRKKFISNPDGTAGSKIHKYIKDRC